MPAKCDGILPEKLLNDKDNICKDVNLFRNDGIVDVNLLLLSESEVNCINPTKEVGMVLEKELYDNIIFCRVVILPMNVEIVGRSLLLFRSKVFS